MAYYNTTSGSTGSASVTASGSAGSAVGPWSGVITNGHNMTTAAGTYVSTTGVTHTVTGMNAYQHSYTQELTQINQKLENVEKMLGIVHTSKSHENRWEELKELGDKYRALYEEVVEKEKIWALLQK